MENYAPGSKQQFVKWQYLLPERFSWLGLIEMGPPEPMSWAAKLLGNVYKCKAWGQMGCVQLGGMCPKFSSARFWRAELVSGGTGKIKDA